MSIRALTEKLSLAELGGGLRLRYAASAQRQILGTVDTCLLLCDDKLINTATGEFRTLSAEIPEHFAASLAEAARGLLGSGAARSGVLLLLPASAFVASSYSVALSGEHLKSALKLQTPTLLPACEQPLQLAVNTRFSKGVALFYPERDAEGLYQAFAAQELNLLAVMPRVLAAADALAPATGLSLVDTDGDEQTLVSYSDGAIEQWLPVSARDLEDAQFAAQWQSALPADEDAVTRLDSEYWSHYRGQPKLHSDYCFYPTGAVSHGKQILARKQRAFGVMAAGVLAFVLLLPFISNWVQLGWLSFQVAKYEDLSAEARSAQNAVHDMEDEWGVVAEYPRQDVAAMLLALNELIDSSLTHFILDKGELEIRGRAQDPALLIEQLEEQELFFNVAQSRSSAGGSAAGRGDSFGIRMNIDDVDFPAFEDAYPESEP